MFTVLCLSRFTTIFFFLLSVILFQIIDTLVHWQKTHGPVLILFLYPLRLGSLSEFHIHLANSSWISPLLQFTLIIFPLDFSTSPMHSHHLPPGLGLFSDTSFCKGRPRSSGRPGHLWCCLLCFNSIPTCHQAVLTCALNVSRIYTQSSL